MSSSYEIICGCSACPDGIARQYMATVIGIANLSPSPPCIHCPDANATYIMMITSDYSGCAREAFLAVCGTADVFLGFSLDGNGYTQGTFTFSASITMNFLKGGQPDCLTPFVAPMHSNGPTCDGSGATVSIVPVPLSLADLSVATCLTKIVGPCPQLFLPAAWLGMPTTCCIKKPIPNGLSDIKCGCCKVPSDFSITPWKLVFAKTANNALLRAWQGSPAPRLFLA